MTDVLNLPGTINGAVILARCEHSTSAAPFFQPETRQEQATVLCSTAIIVALLDDGGGEVAVVRGLEKTNHYKWVTSLREPSLRG